MATQSGAEKFSKKSNAPRPRITNGAKTVRVNVTKGKAPWQR